MRILAWPAFKNRFQNPYNWLLYTHLQNMGLEVDEFSTLRLLKKKYAIWHLHWPERFFNNPNLGKVFVKSAVLLELMQLAKTKGIRIVWTIHNLKSHEGFYSKLETLFWRTFIRMIDGYISLSHTGYNIAQENFPDLKDKLGFVIPHGHYRDIYPNFLDQENAKTRLNISSYDKVLVYIGQIRPYKNVACLIRAFLKLNMQDLTLIIAGKPCSSELELEILRARKGDRRVRLFLNFIPEDEVQLYINAADLVVLPFLEVLNSASALLALSFDRPILIPNKGAMSELKSQFGEDWVMTYESALSPDVLRKGLSWCLNTKRTQRVPVERLNWADLSQKTLEAYKSICEERKK